MNQEDTSMPSPHVLLISSPFQSHVNPLLRLGKRLAAKGLLVTFSTIYHIGLRGIPGDGIAVDVGRGRLRFEYLRDDSWAPDDPRFQDPGDMSCHVEAVGPSALANLIGRQDDAGRPVSCVVSNPFVPWALGVAKDLGIPCAMLWIQSCTALTLYYHYAHALAAFPTEAEPDMSVTLPGLPTLAVDDLPGMVLPALAQSLWAQMLVAQLRDLHKTVSWVLINTFDELEGAAVESLGTLTPVIPVGPLVELEHDGLDESSTADDDDCIAWLDAQHPRSVVYVSLGSFVKIGRDEMAEMAEGLESTGRPFLWAVRGDSPDLHPDEFVRGGKGKTVSWCPQGRVLGHGAVGCFVTHCGWNSTAEALAAGVPVIAHPWWSDQFTNARFLVDVYKVGVRLPAPVKRDALHGCVEEVMGGPEAGGMRMRAARWREKARAAVADGGSSDRNVQAFVDEMHGRGPDR